MIQRIIHIVILCFVAIETIAQNTISGVVTDGKTSLAGVNIFVVGTIDGCLSDSLGRFSFVTNRQGEVTLKATCIGYDDYFLSSDIGKMTHLKLKMSEKAVSIDDVVITASSFRFGKSDHFKAMDALDVVMAGNSCGDIVAALQTLPGTQKVGEDGKLYVRGGESEECQTFINGMHVLEPYSTNVENSAVRGRFSPFLFKGINFSLGGYGGEYGQALSAILPMETTDMATSDKLGVSASLVDWNIGGTKAFKHSSMSFNSALTSMGIYDQMFSQRNKFTRPYRKFSTEAQYKQEFSANHTLKSYLGYDLTSVEQELEDRKLSLSEHNIYANITHKIALNKGYLLFMGVANSSVFKRIKGAVVAGDLLDDFRNEVHLKAEVNKSYSSSLKLSLGMEDYIRDGKFDLANIHYRLDYNIWGSYLNLQWRVFPHGYWQSSLRIENESFCKGWLFMPRTSFNYIPNKRLQASLILGRYSQMVQDEYLMRSDKLRSQSMADHAILSFQYHTNDILLRIEPYYKKYRHLPLLQSNSVYGMKGNGYSRGLDVYLENHSLFKRLGMTMAYSYNDSRRHYMNFQESRMPEFASRHNLRITAKYSLGKMILGLAESYTSGRHFPSGTTPYYNSVDMNVTYLISPKVIVYSSLNNVFGRSNVFRYTESGAPVMSSRDRFFYVGIFVSLKNNKAYDISNF